MSVCVHVCVCMKERKCVGEGGRGAWGVVVIYVWLLLLSLVVWMCGWLVFGVCRSASAWIPFSQYVCGGGGGCKYLLANKYLMLSFTKAPTFEKKSHNFLPREIRHSHSVTGFKSALKTHLFKSYLC